MTYVPRLASALLAPLLVLAACGGRVLEDTPIADASADAPRHSGEAAAPPPVRPPDPSSSDEHPSVADCASRPWEQDSHGGFADALTDEWIHARIAPCQALSGARCGELTVHFTLGEVPGCVDHLIYTVSPNPTFAKCVRTALSAERCGAGIMMRVPQLTIALCN